MSQINREQKNGKAGNGFAPAPEALLLFGLWVLLSGKFDAFHLGIGILLVAFVVWQHRRLAATATEKMFTPKPVRALSYGCWLFWEMMVSAVYVARVILSPRKHLDPRMIKFHSDQPSLFHAVILANSITLTPGTLTVDLEDNFFLVHALTPATAQDVLGGKMAARVARLCGDESIPPPREIIIRKGSHAR